MLKGAKKILRMCCTPCAWDGFVCTIMERAIGKSIRAVIYSLRGDTYMLR